MSVRVVCSAENNAYMAWQSKVFAYSCMTRLRMVPLIVVHTDDPDGDPVCEDFMDLVDLGVPVSLAPQYKNGHPTQALYHPRNTPGSLIHAAESCEADHLMLCDPDLIFRHSFNLPSAEPVSAAWYWTMVSYESPEVLEAASMLGVDVAGRQDLWCGVPYMVKRTRAVELAEAWLEAIDLLPPTSDWQMYAFGLAVLRLGLTVKLGDVVQFNHLDGEEANRAILHYGFEGDGWSKRDYANPREIARVWGTSTDVAQGTVTETIVRQINEAGKFYAKDTPG